MVVFWKVREWSYSIESSAPHSSNGDRGTGWIGVQPSCFSRTGWD